MKISPLSNPIIAALDVDSDQEALRLADQIGDIVGGLKLGPRLCLRYGMSFVKEIAKRSPVFIDQKYFDIPTTTVAAVQASFDAGASLVTVHALNGPETLKALAQLEQKLNEQRPFKVLCVTVLTSFSHGQLPKSFRDESIAWHVKTQSEEVRSAGLSGLVCSPQDLGSFDGKGFFIVTPGIRMPADDKGDQKRTMGPKEAINAGAQALVVGRPILQAKNIREAATAFVKSCF